MEVLDPSLEPYADAWKTEIGRRFPSAVGILVHGGDFVEGQWVVGSSYTPWKHVTPVAEIVSRYKSLYPGRTVVLLACNTGHIELGIPGVYYAHSSVWCLPDRAIAPGSVASQETLESILFPPILPTLEKSRWETSPDVVGNIFEFQSD